MAPARALLAAALVMTAVSGCIPAGVSSPTPSVPPPPPPPREATSATVHGQVTSARGTPVPFASVWVFPANPGCTPLPEGIGATTDQNGSYMANIEVAVSPVYAGCAVVEARSGGTTGRSVANVVFSRVERDRQSVRIDVRLGAASSISAVEAERLVRSLAEAINEPARSPDPELALFVEPGPDALRLVLDQYRHVLGAVRDVAALRPDWSPLPFELRGTSGRVSRVTVERDDLIRLRSPLLDYGARSERFANAYVRFIASGDAEALARLLSPDDIDFPVARARDLVVSYRRRYADTARIGYEFSDIDETRNTITWRLRGPAPGGGEVTELLVFRYGDGLLGVVGLDP